MVPNRWKRPAGVSLGGRVRALKIRARNNRLPRGVDRAAEGLFVPRDRGGAIDAAPNHRGSDRTSGWKRQRLDVAAAFSGSNPGGRAAAEAQGEQAGAGEQQERGVRPVRYPGGNGGRVDLERCVAPATAAGPSREVRGTQLGDL